MVQPIDRQVPDRAAIRLVLGDDRLTDGNSGRPQRNLRLDEKELADARDLVHSPSGESSESARVSERVTAQKVEALMSSDSVDARPDDLIGSAEVPDAGTFAVCCLTVSRGHCVTLWHGDGLVQTDESPQCKLRLSPDQPAVIGRFEGHQVFYLDPSYRPTRLVPGTGQDIMQSEGHGRDRCVSRAHFMLRAIGRGILLVNGVPRPGGGFRAPLNGTFMKVPERRRMIDGEEYPIDSGATAVIVLPNGTEVQIRAE